VPPGGYNVVFNATQYEFWVNAYAPNGSNIFTACMFVEDLNFLEGDFRFFGNQSQYSLFSLNGSREYITFENDFNYGNSYSGDYFYDSGNIGTVCINILVCGVLQINETCKFCLLGAARTFTKNRFETVADVIIRAKGM